jgi:hypothetical protein
MFRFECGIAVRALKAQEAYTLGKVLVGPPIV